MNAVRFEFLLLLLFRVYNQASAGCAEPTVLCCSGENSSCFRGCYCDEACLKIGDCCKDYNQTCRNQTAHINLTTTTPEITSLTTSPVNITTDQATSVTTTNQESTTLSESTATTTDLQTPPSLPPSTYQTSDQSPEPDMGTSKQTETPVTTGNPLEGSSTQDKVTPLLGTEETPVTTGNPLDGSSTQDKVTPPLGPKELPKIKVVLRVKLLTEAQESPANFAAVVEEKLRQLLCKDCTVKIVRIQSKSTEP